MLAGGTGSEITGGMVATGIVSGVGAGTGAGAGVVVSGAGVGTSKTVRPNRVVHACPSKWRPQASVWIN